MQVKYSRFEHNEENKHDRYIAEKVMPVEARARRGTRHSQQHWEREKSEPYVEVN